jgi:molybdopterin-guanine dinucleotide biosynthesis protein A
VRSAILAGGQASRFGGRPKGIELLGGQRILDRVVEAVYSALGRLPILIANEPEALEWKPELRVIRDVMRNCGSLGGIYTALTSEPGPVLVLAWDMPFVTAPLLKALVTESVGFDAYLPESGGPRGVEPLCGVYGPGCASPILMSLAARRFETTSFHSAVRVGTMPANQIRRFGDPRELFFNVNEPTDLERAEKLLASH